MGRWSLHPGGRDPPWKKKLAAVEPEPEPEVEEDFFNPEAALVEDNPFPTELMTEDDAAAVAEAVVEEATTVEPEVEEPEPTYDSMTVLQLQDILRERGLTVSGNKAELIARLEADDAGPSEEAPAETVEAPSEEAAPSDEMPEEGEVSESGGTE
tara:strand:- start:1277 stop:1741 length:465 start_codon:yes stop_codon:yes gene_type:complete